MITKLMKASNMLEKLWNNQNPQKCLLSCPNQLYTKLNKSK